MHACKFTATTCIYAVMGHAIVLFPVGELSDARAYRLLKLALILDKSNLEAMTHAWNFQVFLVSSPIIPT